MGGESRRGADWRRGGGEKSVRRSGPRWIKASLGLFTEASTYRPFYTGYVVKNRSWTTFQPFFPRLTLALRPFPSLLIALFDLYSARLLSLKSASSETLSEKYIREEKFNLDWYFERRIRGSRLGLDGFGLLVYGKRKEIKKELERSFDKEEF